MKEEILASQTPSDNQVSERELQQRKARIIAAIPKPLPDLSGKMALQRGDIAPAYSSCYVNFTHIPGIFTLKSAVHGGPIL